MAEWLQESKGINTKGIIIEPILPLPEQNPNPLVLIFVLNDYVVKGYNI